MTKDISVVPVESGGGDVEWQFTIGRGQFGDFIKGLLGQPRTLEQNYNVIFAIDLNWILDLIHLIDQRVVSQNRASLVGFHAKLYFEDGQIYQLSSPEAFRHFGDKSDSMSTGVEVNWTYLIQFPDKAIPEKQEISLSAFSDRSREKIIKPEEYAFNVMRKLIVPLMGNNSELRVIISYTELTWGQDILSHINNKIFRTSRSPNKFAEATRGIIAFFLFPIGLMALFSIPLLLKIPHSLKTSQIRDSLVGKLNDSVSLDQVSTKLDILVQEYIGSSLLTLPGIAVLFCAFFLLLAAIIFAYRQPRSFVILNEKTKSTFDAYKSKQNKLLYGAFGGLILSIAAGLIANYLTVHLHF